MSFREVVGHRRLLGLLARSAARETLPPSLMFAGPEGVGKRRAAIALAQLLNCLAVDEVRLKADTAAPEPLGDDPSGLPIDACGRCAACRRIARGMHPDVLVMEPGDTGAIKIEQVRELLGHVGYRPFEGRRRVVIIDEADAMGSDAQDALLKSLEEPPPGTMFVLITSRPDALLATVRSRCSRLRFGPLGAAEVAAVLTGEHGYAESEARAVAATADGSVGCALRVASAEFVEARAAAERVLQQAAGGTDPRRRLESAKELVAKAAPGAGERDQLAVHLRALASIVRDLGILATRADAGALANADRQPALEKLARSFDAKRSVRAFTAVDRALAALERNANAKIVADWLVLQL